MQDEIQISELTPKETLESKELENLVVCRDALLTRNILTNSPQAYRNADRQLRLRTSQFVQKVILRNKATLLRIYQTLDMRKWMPSVYNGWLTLFDRTAVVRKL